MVTKFFSGGVPPDPPIFFWLALLAIEVDVIKIFSGSAPDLHTIDNIQFNGERYSVCLPWKVGHGPVPSNYGNALGRLKGQLKSLSKSPSILSECDKIIREHVGKGIIEQVTAMDSNDNVSYLPHHLVFRNDVETTKVRIAYDASCKDRGSGISLNNCLHAGPALTPLMIDMLLRFREKSVV